MIHVDHRKTFAPGDFVRVPRLDICIVAEVKEHSITVLAGVSHAAIPLEPVKANAVKLQRADVPEQRATHLSDALSVYIADARRAAHDDILIRAESERASGHHEGALRICTEALSLFPISVQALRLRAKYHRELRDHAAALRDLDDVIRQGLATAEVFLTRAWCHMRLLDFEKVIADGTEALAISPGYAQACDLLHEAHAALAEFHKERAETYLARRKEMIDPDGKYEQFPLFQK